MPPCRPGRGSEQRLLHRDVPGHGEPQRLLDQAEEPVGVADQVVGLPLGDRPTGPGLGGRPLGRTGGEERRPLASSGATSASSTQAFFCCRARRGA
jgi:hypothetical protein